MKIRTVQSLLLHFILLLQCGSLQNTGPSTEEGNPQIVVIDSKNNPVGGVSVVAYKMDTIINTIGTASQSIASETVTMQTQSNGRCSFTDLPTGTYTFIAQDLSNNRSGLLSFMKITVNATRTDTLFLKSSAKVIGTVTRGGVPGIAGSSNSLLQDAFITVIVQETGITAVTGPNGSYAFTLPSGNYTLFYYATDGFLSAKQEVTLPPDTTITIPTVQLLPIPRLLPPQSITADYDTDKQLVRLSWPPVSFDSLLWYEIERIDLTNTSSSTFIEQDTFFIDSVATVPSGTALNYFIRSVAIDNELKRSAYTGPAEVILE